ncbi:MAG: aminotransferase class V-fold PLP-dependent enzyme [Caulobacteraceae bacterium]|nr:aminotransferase class V-fold PLP-dependent enzyme [Caulobacter sp.]
MAEPVPATRADCEARDARDPLAFTRTRFRLPAGVTYLDGNSLGALPAEAPARVARTVEREWGEGLISSWNAAGWIGQPQRLGARIAPLIGAGADEVICADSTSVNLFKLAAAALRLRPGRRLVIADAEEFPTDLYMLQGLAALVGGVEVRALPEAAWAEALAGGEPALLVSSHVNYRSGALRDMAGWTALAHAAGALALWDLSHSAGAVRVELDAVDADFAVGCGYKYLNGGPGAPAYLFVARRLQGEAQNPLSGWMGHAAPFAFEGAHRQGEGMARWLCGTPSILAMAALEAGLDTFDGVRMAQVEAKAQALCALFAGTVEREAPGMFAPALPPGAPRGSHVSLRHASGYAMVQALIAEGVVGDFRDPDVLRFGFTPLYLGYAEVFDAARRVADLAVSGRWRDPRFAVRGAVT